jgi:hypothetical protein
VLKLTHVFQIHPVYVNFLIVKIVPNSSIVNWHFNPLSSVFTFFKHFQKVKKKLGWQMATLDLTGFGSSRFFFSASRLYVCALPNE